jgi:hypothetical protein
MSKIPGVGYNPGAGTVFWVWPGGASAGTTKFTPAAGDPFGTGTAGTLNLAVFNARYGGRPVRADGTIGLFVVDAETVLGALTRAMELAAKAGEGEFTGKEATHTMVPTLQESHDFAATHPDGGRSLMTRFGVGGGGPGGATGIGQPRITKISSPGPGRIELTWVTGVASAFQIKAGTFEVPFPDPQQGNTRTGVIELPAGLGGELEVTVRAFRDGVPGKWSQVKKVQVEPRKGDKPTDPTDPTEKNIKAIRQNLQGVEADLTAFGAAGADKKALVQSIRQKLQGSEAELKEIEKKL